MRISSYIDGRLFEWGMALAMLLLAIEILAGPQTMLAAGEFRYLALLVAPHRLGGFFLAVSIARGAALVINGRSHVYGPRVRAVGALAGALIWAQMELALLATLIETNVPSPGIPIFLSLTVCEMISSYRAATDVRTRSA